MKQQNQTNKKRGENSFSAAPWWTETSEGCMGLWHCSPFQNIMTTLMEMEVSVSPQGCYQI